MSETAINSFRDALGVSRSINIAVTSRSHAQPEIVSIDGPYGIVGRGSGCDVALTDRLVSFRHVYLQALGDRVICVDLLSPNPITWTGPETSVWLSPRHQVAVGPYTLQLTDDGWASESGDWPSPLDCKTRENDSTPFGALPLVHLELMNRQFKGMTWPINRVLTLVGRDERCRITCADERISRVHCSLLLTPHGLWAIDLLGRGGLRVNGQPRRCAHLASGDELSIGQYLMRAKYESDLVAVPAGERGAGDQGAGEQGAKTPLDTDEIVIPPEILLSEDSLPSPEFLTRNNKVFPVTITSPVVIVEPQGGVRSAGYQELQLESNIVTQLLKTRSKLPHLVVDIHQADVMDSIMVNSVMAMCRAAKGRAVICNASDDMLSVLSEMNLTRLWPHFPTREEAVQHVTAD